jgi:6-phosphogluconolactonase
MRPPAGRFLFPALIFMAMLTSAHSREAVFYLGTYTNNTASKGIYRCSLDLDSGKLGPVSLAIEAKNPTFLALAPNGKFLYAAMEAESGAVGGFAVESDGSLRPLNIQASGGGGACHVSVDGPGRHVFVANYGGGNIACLPIQSDGSLGGKTAFEQFTGSGPHPTRQKKSFAHAIYSDATDRFVYACDLGADKVWSFQFDKEKGTLTRTDPPAGSVPPGSGPRHLAFHPNGRFAYANNEMGLSVTAFARDPATGILTTLQTIPTTADKSGPIDGVTTSEIVCHPSGKWLYVSSRGDDIIAVYAISEDGHLTLLENVPAGVEIPRGMALDPSGKWIVAAGQKDNSIAVLKIDQQTGKLIPTGERAEVGAPVSVTFAALR